MNRLSTLLLAGAFLFMIAPITARGQLTRIGADASPWQFYRGALDNLRIYNRTLTATEIQSDMNTAVGQ